MHNVVSEMNKYNKCSDIKIKYSNCLKDTNSPKICKNKLMELLFCISQTKQPPTVINN